MDKFEKEALATFKKEKPKHWRRYVDDVITVMKVSVVNEMLMHLNSRHENTRFTMEVEEDGRLPMLDVVLHRRKDGGINTTIFRKPTHTERYLPFTSHHPYSMKQAVVMALTSRLSYISSELEEEKE